MTADTVGGVFTYALTLADGVIARGHEVALVLQGPPPSDEQRGRLEAVGFSAVYETRLALEWQPRPWPDQHELAERLREIAAVERSDLLHLNCFSVAAAAWDIPALVIAHSDVLTWWQAVHGRRAPAEWDRYRRAVRRGLQAAAAVVAPTRAMLDALTQAYAVRPRQARVIHNGLEPGAAAPAVKQRFALAAGRLWDEAKNLGTLLRAAAVATGEIRLAGDGADQAAGGSVVALGLLSAEGLAAQRRHAQAFIAPARYEPFGLAVLEAALDGCALVLGDIGTLRELWDGAARFVDPGDALALATEIDRLLSDPVEAAAWGARARARGERYRAQTMVDDYDALYRELVAA